MGFYNDIKGHLSPSALDQWHNNRSGFIKTYFQEDHKKPTAAMKGGTKIHALIEGGMLHAKHIYANAEVPLRIQVPDTDYWFLGIPDSFEQGKFVDYKSGKANNWEEKLRGDLKMTATAWLVWMQSGKPKQVKGAIEFFQTTWNEDAKEIVPIEGKESEVVDIVYTAAQLDAFTKVIIKTINDVNKFYAKWLKSSGDFINQDDVDAFFRIGADLRQLEEDQDEILHRIETQMEFGGEETHQISGLGTFYFRETKSWEYPDDLQVEAGEYRIPLMVFDQLVAASKTSKKNYELANEPIGMKRSIAFRAAAKKNGNNREA